MVARKAPALGVVVVVVSASLAFLGIPSLSLAPAAFCTTACRFAFTFSLSIAAVCFARPFACSFSSSHLRHGCCKLLLYDGIGVCEGALHGGEIGRVMQVKVGDSTLPLFVGERVAALLGRKQTPGPLSLPPNVAVPSRLATASTRNS